MGPLDENGCRPWRGYVNPRTGYGQVTLALTDAERFGCRVATAPVVMATLAHGPRPPGLYVLHSCDVKSCIEPSHLRWGTQAENNQDAWARGRQKIGADHHQARHSDDEVRIAIERVRSGESAMSVAQAIGIDNSILSKWVRGQGRGMKTLKEITGGE